MAEFHHNERTHNRVIRGKRHRWVERFMHRLPMLLPPVRDTSMFLSPGVKKGAMICPESLLGTQHPGFLLVASSDWKLPKFQTLRKKADVQDRPYQLANNSNAKFPDTRGQPCKQDFQKNSNVWPVMVTLLSKQPNGDLSGNARMIYMSANLDLAPQAAVFHQILAGHTRPSPVQTLLVAL